MEQNKSQAPADQIFTRSNNSKVLHRNVGQFTQQLSDSTIEDEHGRAIRDAHPSNPS